MEETENTERGGRRRGEGQPMSLDDVDFDAHEILAGDPGNAISIPQVSVVEMGEKSSLMVTSPDNRVVEGGQDFCGRHEYQHQTERKEVVGALRQEKTDRPRPYPEVMAKRNSSASRSPRPLAGLFEVLQGGMVEEKEKTGQEEKALDETCAEVELQPVEIRTRESLVCPDIGMMKMSEKDSTSMQKREESKQQSGLGLKLQVKEEYGLSPKLQGKEEYGLSPKLQDKENKEPSSVDNKLLEGLDALPILQRLKTQIKLFTCCEGIDTANKVLSEFLQLWKIVDKVISRTTEMMGPGISSTLEGDVKGLLHLLSPAEAEDKEAEQTERNLTDTWMDEKGVMEDLKTLMMGAWQGDEPKAKWEAMEMTRDLSQQKNLTNSMLTNIYTCLQQNMPASLHHKAVQSVHDRSRHLWDSMKEEEHIKDLSSDHDQSEGKSMENLSTDLGQDKEGKSITDMSTDCGEGKSGKEAMSLKADFTCQQHLSELSVEDEQRRLPVENSFYFSTYFNPSTLGLSGPTEYSHTSRRGRELKVILSLMRKFVSHIGHQPKTEWQLGKETDREKGDAGTTEIPKEQLEVREILQIADIEEDSETPDTEILEKVDFEEQEKTMKDDVEIIEKCDIEESEKSQKVEDIYREAGPGKVPSPPVGPGDTARNREPPSSMYEEMAGSHPYPAENKLPLMKTEKKRKKVKNAKKVKKQETNSQRQKKERNSCNKGKRCRILRRKKEKMGSQISDKQEISQSDQHTPHQLTAADKISMTDGEQPSLWQQTAADRLPAADGECREQHSPGKQLAPTRDLNESLYAAHNTHLDKPPLNSVTKHDGKRKVGRCLAVVSHPKHLATLPVNGVTRYGKPRSVAQNKASLEPAENQHQHQVRRTLEPAENQHQHQVRRTKSTVKHNSKNKFPKKARKNSPPRACIMKAGACCWDRLQQLPSTIGGQQPRPVRGNKQKAERMEKGGKHKAGRVMRGDKQKERRVEREEKNKEGRGEEDKKDRGWPEMCGGVVMMLTTSDSQQGTPGGSAQSGGSSHSTSQGGSSGAHDWGGARPKTTRNGGNGGSGGDGDGGDRRPPKRNVPNSLHLATDIPADPRTQRSGNVRNYKRHRKKQHGAISNELLCHCLGQAGKGIDTLQQSNGVGELNRCLSLCLHNTQCVTSPTQDDLVCCTCAILHSLLSHFSSAAHGDTCPMCLQLFTLVHFHVLQCHAGWRSEEEEESSRNVCLKMRQAHMFTDTETTVTTGGKVWVKVRKYLSAALGPVLLLDLGVESEAVAPADLNHQPSGAGEVLHSQDQEQGTRHHFENAAAVPTSAGDACPASGASSAKQTSQGAQVSSDLPTGHAAVMPKATAGSNLRRRPSTRVVPQKTIPEEPGSPHPSPTPPASPARDVSQNQDTGIAAPQVTLPLVFPTRAETPEEGDDYMIYIRRFQQQLPQKQQLSRHINDDPYATTKTYGMGGTISMPEPRDRLVVVDQNLSVEMRPIGVPGIGEVVYGTQHQLQLVAHNWRQERDTCKVTGYCRYQHREEGVILHAFRKVIKILHTRYQKHYQWERLVHLGNGVTGKCHLCIDRTSNFKFCCKKVHILQYEDQELDIWSELDHPNIVRFYGAIRHGEKIYMFAEFIDGGSLAAMIKEQWLVGRRLSHWTALNYFRQLLTVLTYLQNMGVLHEDIKADNLLLRDGTTEIVLADFGVAQQIPHDHTPPNRIPTGSPAHWSPEKAASEGHGFTSDLWASACVLIHMLSGSPPWICRFPDASILNYIIWSRPPPMDDVPSDVKESVRDLLSCCLVKDQAIRPLARQILQHPAFTLLDQAGSFFSIAQHAAHAPTTSTPASIPVCIASCQETSAPCQSTATVPTPTPVSVAPCQETAAPCQSVQTAPQLSTAHQQHSQQPQAAAYQGRPSLYQHGQTSHQSEEVATQSGCQLGQASSSHVEASNQPQQVSGLPQSSVGVGEVGGVPVAARLSESTVNRPVVTVVEIPRRSSTALSQSGGMSGPQSLPETQLSGNKPSYHDQHPSHPALGHPPVHRKSDPAPLSLFSPQEGQSASTLGRGSAQAPAGLGLSLDARDNWLPALWPELPSPALTLASQASSLVYSPLLQSSVDLPGTGGAESSTRLVDTTGQTFVFNAEHTKPDHTFVSKTQDTKPGQPVTTQLNTSGHIYVSITQHNTPGQPVSTQHNAPGDIYVSITQHNSPGLPVTTQHSAPGEPTSTMHSINTTAQHTMPSVLRCTLSVPDPVSQNQSQGSDQPVSSATDQENLSSYGTGIAVEETGDVDQPSVESVVTSSLTVPADRQVQNPLVSVTSSSCHLTQPPAPLPRVALTRSAGGGTQVFTVIPQTHSQAASFPTPAHPPQLQLPGSENNSSVPTSALSSGTSPTAVSLTSSFSRPVFSSFVNTTTLPPGEHTTQPFSQVQSLIQPTTPGSLPQPSDCPMKYPVLPDLSAEDFRVTVSRRSMVQVPPLLSMIPEAVEQESMSAGTHVGSSLGSSEGTVWNYIQDQFTTPPDTQDQLVSLQTENRPRLELYAPSGLATEESSREESFHQQRSFLPRFELLQSSLSDSSTLRSGRITMSLGESSLLSQFQSQIQGPADSGISQQTTRGPPFPHDEPDIPFIPAELNSQGRNSSSATGQIKFETAGSPVTQGNADEERISSGDLYGSGPSADPGFEEAHQYRQQQQNVPPQLPPEIHQYRQQQQQNASPQLPQQQHPIASPQSPQEAYQYRQQQQNVPPLPPLSYQQAQPSQTSAAASRMSRKPNLRLNVAKFVTSMPQSGQGHSEGYSMSQSWAMSETGPTSHPQGDDPFLLHPGVSPMTASPLSTTLPSSASTPSSTTPRHAEVRPRSRNESGSSASTPKSSTYDRQEQEWTTLQQQTPGFENALLEDPMVASGSDLSSTTYRSLLYEFGETSTPDQEENDVLSMLQEGISNEQLGGQRLVFENEEGEFLFNMRVLGKNKGWKELALTFRRMIYSAGFHHYTLMQDDGTTPIDYFSFYDPAITKVKVIHVSDEGQDVHRVCWCEDHLFY